MSQKYPSNRLMYSLSVSSSTASPKTEIYCQKLFIFTFSKTNTCQGPIYSAALHIAFCSPSIQHKSSTSGPRTIYKQQHNKILFGAFGTEKERTNKTQFAVVKNGLKALASEERTQQTKWTQMVGLKWNEIDCGGSWANKKQKVVVVPFFFLFSSLLFRFFGCFGFVIWAGRMDRTTRGPADEYFGKYVFVQHQMASH